MEYKIGTKFANNGRKILKSTSVVSSVSMHELVIEGSNFIAFRSLFEEDAEMIVCT